MKNLLNFLLLFFFAGSLFFSPSAQGKKSEGTEDIANENEKIGLETSPTALNFQIDIFDSNSDPLVLVTASPNAEELANRDNPNNATTPKKGSGSSSGQ